MRKLKLAALAIGAVVTATALTGCSGDQQIISDFLSPKSPTVTHAPSSDEDPSVQAQHDRKTPSGKNTDTYTIYLSGKILGTVRIIADGVVQSEPSWQHEQTVEAPQGRVTVIAQTWDTKTAEAKCSIHAPNGDRVAQSKTEGHKKILVCTYVKGTVR